MKHAKVFFLALTLALTAACLLGASSALAGNVWVDDNWAGSSPGDPVGGHVFGTDAFATIQDGINNVTTGDTVFVANGTYNERPNVNQSMVILGANETAVIVDAGAATSGSYGFSVSGDNVTVSKLTLVGDTLLSTPRYGFKPSSVNNFTLSEVTVREFYRTGVDLLGVNGGAITDVTSIDNNGHGFAFTDCNNITVTDIVGSDNAWQNVSVATWGRYSPLGTSGMVFQGTSNSFDNLFQLEMGDYNNPGVPPSGNAVITYSTDIADGADVTVQASDFGFALHGEQDDSPDQVRIWFFETLADAALIPAYVGPVGHWTGNDMYIEDLVDGTQLHVTNGGSIQAAIDAADPGDDINVGPGYYKENIDVHTRVTILGAGSGVDTLSNTVIAQDPTGAGDTKIGVVQLTTSGTAAEPIHFESLRVAPDGMAGFSVGRFTEATGTSVSYVEMTDVIVVGNNVNPNTEQERGLYVDLTSSLTNLDITDCAFDSLTYGWYFQKEVSADASTVQYVTVTNTTFNHNNLKGVYAEKLSDVTFEGCTVSENGFSDAGVPSYFLPWMSGFDINLKAGTYANLFFNNCTVTDNALGGAKEGVGLTVKGRGTGDNPSGSYTSFPAWVDNVQVNGGTYTGNERGLRFGEPGKGNASPTNVVITDADIYGNVQTYTGTDGSDYGDVINMMQAGIGVDAEANYWGVITYPAISSLVSGDVDFDPWCSDATHTNCTLTGTLTEVWVDDDWAGSSPGDVVGGHIYGYDAFDVIQDGVDYVDATGTVNVAAGTYNETLTISKALSVLGATGAIMDGTGLGLVTAVNVQSGDVTFDNIDVLNYGGNGIIVGYEADPPGDLQNVQITNCTVGNIQPGSSHGFGIYVGYEAEGFTSSPVDLPDHLDYSGLLIDNNEVYNTANAAMVLQSITATTGQLMVTGNNLHDAGASGLWIDAARDILVDNNEMHSNANGIWVSYLANYGNVDGPYDPKDLTFTNNNIHDNSGYGIALWAGWPSTITAEYNWIQDNGTNAQNGLASGTFMAERNFWGTINYNDIDAGTSGDVDFDPWCNADHSDCSLSGIPAVVWVDDDWVGSAIGDPVNGHTYGYDAWHVIQDGVDNVADGGTVNIMDGNYYESNITVGSAMSIIGESRAGVVIAPAAEDDQDASSFGGTYQHGFIVGADDVSIQSLTLNGEANPSLTAGKNNYRIGVVTADGSAHANTAIDDVSIEHTYFRGVFLYGTAGGSLTGSLVNDVELDVYNAYGFLMIGSSMTGVCDISNNTFTGIGGRAIGTAHGSYTVSGNDINDAYTGLYNFNYGFPDETVTMTGNQVTNTYTGANLVGLTNTTVIGGPNPADANTFDMTTVKSGSNGKAQRSPLIGENAAETLEWTANPNKDASTEDIGILLWWSNTTCMIQGNTVTASAGDAGAWVFHCEDSTTFPTLQGNTFTATASDGTNVGEGTGIFVTDDGNFLGDEPGWTFVNVFDNTISGFARGVHLYRNAASPANGRNSDAWMTGNNISGCGVGVVTNGGFIREFTNNFVTGCTGDGLSISTNVETPEVSALFESDLSGNGGLAINNTTTLNLNASGCYFGSADPTTVAAMVTANVDYTPWLVNGADQSTDPGYQGDFSELRVDDDSPQTGSVAYIKEALDLVSGSTIYLSAGTYEEQVVIDTDSIVVQGDDPTTVFINSPTNLTDFFNTGSNDNYPVFYVHDAEGVELHNVTLDGLGRGNANYRFIGVGYYNAGGTVSNCTIKNIQDTPFSGSQHGVAVYVYAPDTPDRTFAINDCHVVDFQKNGVTFLGEYLTADISGCDVDGKGGTSVTAQNGIQYGLGADGTALNNTITGIAYTGASWTATGFLLQGAGTVNASGIDIDQCQTSVYWIDSKGTFDGGSITSPNGGDGFYVYRSDPAKGAEPKRLAQPMDADLANNADKAPMTVDISNTDFVGVDMDNSWGVGVFSTSSDDVAVTMSDCLVKDWNFGVFYYDYGGIGAVSGDMSGNSILGCDSVGLVNQIASLSVTGNTFANATNADDGVPGNTYDGNCWNDWSGTGPYAVGGTGGNVDNNPTADCSVDMTPDDIVHLDCAADIELTLSIGEALLDMEGVNTAFEYPAELTFASATALDANFQILPTSTSADGSGMDTVYIPLVVLTGSIDGPYDLMTVSFTPANLCAVGEITMIEGDFRDGDNNVIPAILPDPTTIVVDCDDPVFTVNGPADGGFYNTAPVLDIQASDNCDIDDIYYQVDGCAGGPWTPIVTDFAGAVYSDAAWALPDFASLSEANHCIYFKVIDDNTRGNADSCTFTWCFTKDVTPPDPPTDFTAEPRHNAIELAWTNSVSTDAIGVQIQRVPWGDYPEYATAAPGYPADQTIGTTAYDGTDESYRDDADFDNTNRDIYYYGAFAYDAAGNYSAATTSAQARATSYWLGDVAGSGGFGDYDGFVYAEDLGPLTVSYGKTDTDPGWNAELDYGPTWDDATSSPGGATDIPIPDDSVNFEDGIIFAINFDAVNPTMKTVPLLAGKEIDGPLAVHLVNYGDGVYGLELNNNIGEVKGFSVELTLNNNQTTFERVELAETITNTEALTFAKALPGENSLTFDFLLLGNGRTIGGSGPIATLHFAGADPQVELANADVRDNDNKEVTVELIQTSPADLVPNEYRLSQNYPNPFNPTTTIDFNVRSQGHVTLEVYNALGQRVKTLVDEVRDAGQHSVMWDGTDVNGNSVASGMYLYRLTINSFSDTRKMMLLK